MPSLFRAFVQLYIEKIALVFSPFLSAICKSFLFKHSLRQRRNTFFQPNQQVGHRRRLLKMRYLPTSGKYSAARSLFLLFPSLNFGSLVQK